MREPPTELSDAEVLDAVRSGWDPEITRVRHLSVGFGAYHWRADVDETPRLFVTYDRFGSRHSLDSLTAAYAGAIALAAASLEFVVAPLLADDGRPLRPIGAGALSCTPWLVGHVVGDGSIDDPATAAANLRDLSRLHATPSPVGLGRWRPLVGPDFVVDLAARVAEPWDTGPQGEPARTAVAARLGEVRAWTARYRDLAARARRRPWTATHGETHTRNQLRTTEGIRFVDWESLLLAPRERDLATLVQAGYGDAAGADPAMIELFDLEWRLSEIDVYAAWFAAPHAGTPDDAIAYAGLLDELDRAPW